MNIPFHRATQELLAAHELFRRLGFTPAELGPIINDKQVLFRATHDDLNFTLAVAGEMTPNVLTAAEIERIRGEYPEAANWWNAPTTPEMARAFIWLNSSAFQTGTEITFALARKRFPLSKMIAAKEAAEGRGKGALDL